MENSIVPDPEVYQKVLLLNQFLTDDNVRLIQQRAADAETIDHLRRTTCRCNKREILDE